MRQKTYTRTQINIRFTIGMLLGALMLYGSTFVRVLTPHQTTLRIELADGGYQTVYNDGRYHYIDTHHGEAYIIINKIDDDGVVTEFDQFAMR